MKASLYTKIKLNWWVGVVVVVVESKSSDRLWQSFSLALAKPNNNVINVM